MPHFWDYFGGVGGGHNTHRNLQDGLFQIASQTCSLLVQVNNTNNISYGNNSTNIHNNSLGIVGGGRGRDGDREQLVVLLPPSSAASSSSTSRKSSVSRTIASYRTSLGDTKKRLSTVLETSSANEEEADIWSQVYALPDVDASTINGWGKKAWCKPSCIPISIILIMIFLVVLLPLLDHNWDKAYLIQNEVEKCPSTCSISLVESIPQGMFYPNGTLPYPSTHKTWMNLIMNARHTIEIGSYYWTLRKSDVMPDPSSKEGEQVFQALLRAGRKRGIKIKIAQNAPSRQQPNLDTELLVKKKAAEVRSLNFAQLLGDGILHTKLWIIDRKHLYIGSANMDWRSLTQVKELGVMLQNCTCLAKDMGKIFDVYWKLGEPNATVPKHWPPEYETVYNVNSPMDILLNNISLQAYVSSAPPPFSPTGRTDDIDAIINIITRAEKFIYIAVMDYIPLTIFTPKLEFWPTIDNMLRKAAIENKIHVRMLISLWNHSHPAQDNFLRSLQDISNSTEGVRIEVQRFIIPANESQSRIPYARVNHNKYMVTDNTAYIGTSNWSGDYFTSTAGAALIVHEQESEVGLITVRSQLQAVFERDWFSNYSVPFH